MFKDNYFLLIFLTFIVFRSVDSQITQALEAKLKAYIDTFNAKDEELYVEDIPNNITFNFLKNKIPLFECPDKVIEEIYYFRWWTWRKHIRTISSIKGALVVMTEFMPPVQWAGTGNTICAGAGHHIMEGRWLRGNDSIMNGYTQFWTRGGGNPRRYSFALASSLWNRFLVNGDFELLRPLLHKIVQNYNFWDKMRLDDNGLYWQKDDFDGMEMSIGGYSDIAGYRATINSYQYGDAIAISKMAVLNRDKVLAKRFRDKAKSIRRVVEAKLWDANASFFKVLPRTKRNSTLVDVRELHGFTPWYFNLPSENKSVAWLQLNDSSGFRAPFGLTSAEQRHPRFELAYKDHECQWNGPSWPFATSITLTALANLLNNYKQSYVSRFDYLEQLRIYAQAQHLMLDSGEVVPWIDENLHPYTGDWISRTRLKGWADKKTGERGWSIEKGGRERGKDYNHSTFCDLVISGLIGLRPRAKDIVDINPLVPAGEWAYFILENVEYHGRLLTIMWDESGTRYNKGKGFQIFVNGQLGGRSDTLSRIRFNIRRIF